MWRAPAQAAGNHQVNDEPKIILNSDRDPLADAPDSSDDATFDAGERGGDGAKQKRTCDPDLLDRLSEDSRFDRPDVSGDVGEFRHSYQIAAGTRCCAISLSASWNPQLIPGAGAAPGM
jgi:hypothetical protein